MAEGEIMETTNRPSKLVNTLIPPLVIMRPLLTKTLIACPSRLKTPICEQTILVLFAGSMATTHIFVHLWSEFNNFWLLISYAKDRRLLKHSPIPHNLSSHRWSYKTPYPTKA